MIRRTSARPVAAAALLSLALLSVGATVAAHDRHASTTVVAEEETASTAGGHTANRSDPTGH